MSVDNDGASFSGMLNDIPKRRQAGLVLVPRECVQYLIRSGCSFPRDEPDRNSLVGDGDGSDCAANLTALNNSPLATAETKGSKEDNILIA